MLSKMKYLGNCAVVLFALMLGVGCGSNRPPQTRDPVDPDASAFCGGLYNAQRNIYSKMEQCNGYISQNDQFSGFDVPGFPPRAGYCVETFGDQCKDQKSALDSLSDCVALMPVCVPDRATAWVEQWRYACVKLYNKNITNPDCHIRELKINVRRSFPTVSQDEE